MTKRQLAPNHIPFSSGSLSIHYYHTSISLCNHLPCSSSSPNGTQICDSKLKFLEIGKTMLGFQNSSE
ncbi:hypothetical protein Hanom_Chr14g01271581 [Helianthus anomalus]